MGLGLEGRRHTTHDHDAIRVPAEAGAWVWEAVCSESWVWKGEGTPRTTMHHHDAIRVLAEAEAWVWEAVIM